MLLRTDELIRRLPIVWAIFLPLMTGGCGSASQTVTGPSTTKCAVAASADTASFPPAGGTGHLTVNTNRECAWSVAASSAWIRLDGTPSGQGEARLSFTVLANGDPAARQGTITVSDQQVAISQEAAPCTFTVDPIHASLPAAGGRGTVRVTASSALCTWTARSEAPWIAIREGLQGTGDGQVQFEVEGTSGPTRNGSLTVADQRVMVVQGDGCSVRLDSTSRSVDAAGGTSVVNVIAGEGCAWTASSAVSWITIAGAASGAGPGELRLDVAANTGPQRSGTVTIGGVPLAVTQASGCNASISPANRAFAAAGGTASISVAVGTGCTWTAASAAPWISVTSGASGSGTGDVRISVAENTGPERSGRVTVAGRQFTATQASGCRVSLAATSGAFAAAGGAGSVNVTVGAGCGWTAVASDAWVRISTGASGSGPGAVSFAVEPNVGPARQASITIGGQVFAISQESGCTFTLSAPGIAFTAAGGGGTVSVQTAGGCSWTASVSEPWVRISSGAEGTGPGPVNFLVEPNGGPERSATLTVAGQPYAIRQTASE